VDEHGRVFGRINLVDALFGVFVLGLIPVAYSTWLLVRPPGVRIRSVEPSAITWAERRVAGGLPILLKVKVHADNLTPVLRATIDGVPAIGFTFETPESGDVIIGDNVPIGRHDLIFYDGVQEVARARRVIEILPLTDRTVRAIGTFTEVDEATARTLQVGRKFAIQGAPSGEVLAMHAEDGATGEREAIVRLNCEPDTDASVCRLGSVTSATAVGSVIAIPGTQPPLHLRISAIVPDAAPRPAIVRVRVMDVDGVGPRVRIGDRDMRLPSIDDRAATVSAVDRGRAPGTFDLVLRLGVDKTVNGWAYHAQVVQPGGAFPFATNGYAIAGAIVDLVLDDH